MVNLQRVWIFITALLVVGLVGCNQAKSSASQQLSTETLLPPPAVHSHSVEEDVVVNLALESPTAVLQSLTPTPDPLASPLPTGTLSIDASLEPTVIYAETDVLTGDHFWLARPFSTSNGIRDYVESAYPYGTTALGYQPHHGVDIPNPIGATVRATASGIVFYAGDDLNTIIFGPWPNFYGNVIVIEHNFEVPSMDGVIFKMYTLYGHLSELYVRTGDEVSQFQEIGAVGQEGVAIGPHLHLEVRITDDPYDYESTYNPNLWVQPWSGYGVLAGRVLLRSGGYLPNIEIEVESLESGRVYRTLTYTYDMVNPDPWFRENFVVPDLMEGRYEVRVNYQGRVAYRTTVDIRPEQTSIINAFIE